MSSPNSTTLETNASDKSTDNSSSNTNSAWRTAARQNQGTVEQDDTSTAAAVPYLPTVDASTTAATPLSEQQLDLQQPNLIPQVDITGNNDTVNVQAQDATVSPQVAVTGNNDTVTVASDTASSDTAEQYGSGGSSQTSSGYTGQISANSVNVNVTDGAGDNVNVNVNNGTSNNSTSVNVSNGAWNDGSGTTVNVNTGASSEGSGNTVNVNTGAWDGSGNAVNVSTGQYNEGGAANPASWSDGTINVSGNNDTVNITMSGADPVISQFQQSDPTLAQVLTDSQSQMSGSGYGQYEQNVYQNWASGTFPDDESLLQASAFQLQQQGGSASDVAAAQNVIQNDIGQYGDSAVSTFGNPVSTPDPDNMNVNITGNNDTVNVTWNGGNTASTSTGGGGNTGGGGDAGGGSGGSGAGGGDAGAGAGGYAAAPDYSTNPEMLAATQEMTAGVQALGQIKADPGDDQLYSNEATTDFNQAQTDLDQAAIQLGLPMPTQSALVEGDQNADLTAAQRLATYQGDAPGQDYSELAYDGRLASHEEQNDGASEPDGPQGDIFLQTLMNGQNNGQAGVFLDTPQDAQYFLQALTQSIGSDGQLNGNFLRQTTADTYYQATGTDILPILNQQTSLEANTSAASVYESMGNPLQPGGLQQIEADSGWNDAQIIDDALWGHLQFMTAPGQITEANASTFLANAANQETDPIDAGLVSADPGTLAEYNRLADSANPADALNNAFLSEIGQDMGISDLPYQAALAGANGGGYS